MAGLDFISIGEVLIDMIPGMTKEGASCFLPKVGGAPVNVACVLARLGCRSGFVGRVGRDAFGRQITAVLQQQGVDTSLLQQDEERETTLAFVHLNEEGERSFSFYRNGLADTRLEVAEEARRAVRTARMVHFGSVALAEEPERSAVLTLIAEARQAGRIVSYDPNLRFPLWSSEAALKKTVLETLQYADLIKLSDEEAQFLFGISDPAEAAHHVQREYGTAMVFVTCGRNGAWGCTGKETAFAPALQIDCVDTTGAGDCFLGAACLCLLNRQQEWEKLSHEELEEILRFACAAGSMATTKRGAIDAIPMLEEIQAAL